MASLDARIPMSRIMKDFTMDLTITGYRSWWLRMRVGLFFIRLASWVMGMPIEVHHA